MEILQFIKRKFLWVILLVVVFYVVFILVSDVEKIFEHFLQIRAEFLFLILFLVFLSHIVKSFRQKELLNNLGEKIPWVQNLVIYMAGLSLINTPGGVGTFIKSIYLKNQFQIPTNKSISVIFMERYHDLLAGTTIILVSIFMYFSSVSISLLIISSVILIGVYVLIKNKRFSEFTYKKISKIKFISKNLPDDITSNSFYILTNSKNMTKGWLFSIFGWCIDSMAVYVAFLVLNVDLGYILISQIYFTSIGYGVLSFLPGGIGVNESIADFLLVQQGLELSVATSLVILTRLTTTWFATIIGIGFTRNILKKQRQSH
ncbi:MAG: flippase-like domain-containing protein [Nitrosopumilus sp.]|uniref:lysylphosphatidylglycerol synthase transmembrane domain-containing protein n=1 Tax=Nitrosopumilus sp. TaxID=2024843 RepID=UPI00246B5923|nr:lysylphosphatidylglycerol synthase transmembrane domain-containing protein [Nitrosopumilus sp.]MDH5431765.1 flippase-like domain-containing protein [Nitrosopumilus sp.]